MQKPLTNRFLGYYKGRVDFLQLKSIDLFSSMTDEEISLVSGSFSLKKFRKNDVILQEQDTNEFMYMILSGKVKVVQVTEDGKETIIAFHKSGDFFGEMSLIDGKTVPATVVAIENSNVAIISKKDFYTLLLVQNKFIVQLLRILCSRLREAYERIQILSFNNAAQRIRMLFIMLANMYGREEDKGIRLDIKLTHQNIADMTGIARETVTRLVNRAQKDNEIFFEGKVIYLNPEYIRKDFDIKR
ncbi:MAG: Crp/Fnr family transcriptional regulator [Nitrospiraceae bacterium]|nr:Crp/Fnr family transcriptional regulator [Nitrospiraceae bacterium]